MSKIATLRSRIETPDLTADLHLYPSEQGGRKLSIDIGWGCPCAPGNAATDCWDGYPLLDTTMLPGERRRVGFFFLSGADAVNAIRPHGKFYLRESRVIGEAIIIADRFSTP
ncbi:hypothetical protein ABMA32_00865 [Mesorhizobium sp. VNQ89]|uniref:hypothetical protein n=1 Tax=Mesorhizobium quangtriensis TaxID=3157709 RepID=UPI0032B7864D